MLMVVVVERKIIVSGRKNLSYVPKKGKKSITFLWAQTMFTILHPLFPALLPMKIADVHLTVGKHY